MHEAKNTQRALVRIGYDGRVHKTFRGPKADERYANEVRVLQYLESRQCPFVPRVLARNDATLEVTLSNCGTRVQQISPEKVASLFTELEEFGVRHDDPFDRNITYRATDGRFCIIDFEFATIIGEQSTTDVVRPTEYASHATRLKWSARSHVGRFRKNNEDTYLAAKIQQSGLHFLGVDGQDILDRNEWIFAVSDGMGGENSGEFASRITVQRATSILPKYLGGGLSPTRELSQAVLRTLIDEVHADLIRLGRFDKNLRNMGATLTLVWLRENVAFFVHVGDSRLYYLTNDGGMRQLTEDHSHVGWLLKNGKINEREFRSHPRRGVLSQCLGSGHQFLKPQTGFVEINPGDKILLCTDGVVDGHFDRGLQEMVTNPPAAWRDRTPADRLVYSAVETSGRDNSSAVVVEFE